MHCRKCGEQLPDNAEYCYECGTKVNEVSNQIDTSDINVITFDRRIFIAALLFFAITIFLIMGALFDYANRNASENQHQLKSIQEEDKSQKDSLSDNAILLQGTIEVGENKDLPAGKYEIRGVGKKHYIFIRITKENDKNYEEYINTYDTVNNYILKEGYILDVGSEVAFTRID